ncbi:Uncharacterised protein [Mycobacterium tuberculosis]|nr:Uncharacterised protein [Mycobacterium tuberculosis]
MLGAIRINALHQPRPLVMHVDFLATIGVKHRDAPVVIPGIPRVHLRKTGPMPDASRRLARPFPLPEETRSTGQTTFKNDVLIVVPINLTFADGIGRRNQPSKFVVGVGKNTLLSDPDVGLITLCPLNLVINGDDMSEFITQKKRAPNTVIHAFDAPRVIPGNAQPVAIRIADRR